jgi:hypothetical protein
VCITADVLAGLAREAYCVGVGQVRSRMTGQVLVQQASTAVVEDRDTALLGECPRGSGVAAAIVDG